MNTNQKAILPYWDLLNYSIKKVTKLPIKPILVGLLLILTTPLWSQTVSGIVTDENSQPMVGGSVVVLGTNEGTITDIEGKYTVNASALDTLVFSFVGYEPVKSFVGNRTEVNIEFSESSNILDGVVVTSLGMKRDKKVLGYATQKLDAKQISAVRSTNMVNSLAGKLAGVQVTGGSNGLASSSRIIVRGESSLNLANNSPLFVIDGIPINNTTYDSGGASSAFDRSPTDFGNGAAEINPNDIESINVLKGAAAAALYGSRAANGVILIKTKSGKKQKGIGVSITSSSMFSSPLVLPKLQNQYGGGWGGVYYPDFGTNFGPRFSEDLNIVQDGSPNFESDTAEPFVSRYDINDFFERGTSFDNQIALTGGNDFGSFKLSYANSSNTGILPNTNLTRDYFSVKASYRPTKNWTVDVSANYIKSGSDNLPVTGRGVEALMYNVIWNYTNADVDWFRDYWVTEGQQQRYLFTWGDNPFFALNENTNSFNKNRLFGAIVSTYNITPELSLLLRIGTDYSNDFRQSRRSVGSLSYPDGMYREQNFEYQEVNADFLLSYEKRFQNDNFSTKISVGGNRFDQRLSNGSIEGRGLAIPEIYTLGNINVQPILSRYNGNKRINSVYAFANIGYRDFLYLDLTARNDWSSALPLNNNSYFYPSASLSFLPSEIWDMGSTVDFLKLRANVAQVGNDPDPFQLVKTYQFGELSGSLTNPSALPNANLKPEQTTAYEFGIEGSWFKRRLLADVTYYNTVSTDQIISFSTSEASGFKSVFANSGEIVNNGVEVVLQGSPIRTNSFEWRVGVNYSRNRSRINEIYGDLESYIISPIRNGVAIEARPGGRMGDIYGETYVRNEEGQIVFGSNGLPLRGPRGVAGNYNPDWMMGVSSNITYKNFSLFALFDGRKGGVIYSLTNMLGKESGILESSLPGRETGLVGEGVVQNADGTYSPNTVNVSPETYYYGGIAPRANAEANSLDASFIKLRELSLSYSLPQSLISKLGLKSASIALVGNNLALWAKTPNIDPETQGFENGVLVPGVDMLQTPSARSYGISFNCDF